MPLTKEHSTAALELELEAIQFIRDLLAGKAQVVVTTSAPASTAREISVRIERR